MECKYKYMYASYEQTSPLSNFARSGRRELTRLRRLCDSRHPFVSPHGERQRAMSK